MMGVAFDPATRRESKTVFDVNYESRQEHLGLVTAFAWEVDNRRFGPFSEATAVFDWSVGPVLIPYC